MSEDDSTEPVSIPSPQVSNSSPQAFIKQRSGKLARLDVTWEQLAEIERRGVHVGTTKNGGFLIDPLR